MTQPVFTRCIFCLLISLQSFTAWPEAVPSPPVVSLLHLQDSAFPSVPMLQSEPPFLHTPQAGNFNSVFIHFYQKTSCTQGTGFFPLSPKLNLDWLNTRRGCPGRLWCLCPWRYSKPDWAQPWETCFRWRCPAQGLGQAVSRSPCQPHPFCEWLQETPVHCLQPALCENSPPCCSNCPAESVLPALRLFLWLVRQWRSQALGFSDAKKLEFPPPVFIKTDGVYGDCW